MNDFLVGAPFVDLTAERPDSGAACVIYGSKTGLSNLHLSGTIDPTKGFVMITGAEAFDQIGNSVASAGDTNGDGIYDLLIGAKYANNEAGKVYVIYGNKNSLRDIDLTDGLDASQGFQITNATSDQVVYSVSGLGDIDADGIHDIIVSSTNSDPLENGDRIGGAYVIFGSKTFPDIVGMPLEMQCQVQEILMAMVLLRF